MSAIKRWFASSLGIIFCIDEKQNIITCKLDELNKELTPPNQKNCGLTQGSLSLQSQYLVLLSWAI